MGNGEVDPTVLTVP